ncbi:MAG: hypothetical protein KGJ78_09735 [Alphaproteobacteria bacterium]|nr:hypothetical protein [Alphaproteobacteria bacterium]
MSEHAHGESAHLDVHAGAPGGAFRYVPWFLFVLILYVIGRTVISEPRMPFISLGAYQLSWVEVLLLCASVIALIEQMKVSHPGIDNTMEALSMVGMGVIQLILFVLGAAKVHAFGMFSSTEFLMQTFISLAAAVVAILINARTLRRTIGVGDN